MTLGERITTLRTGQKMSQGDLAEKLGVSRQSVSKWETDASVPDLDKLILLSDLFHISLDELVRGTTERENTSEEMTNYENREDKKKEAAKQGWTIQKVMGLLLMILGIVSCLVSIVLSPLLFIAGACLMVYGVICLYLKDYVVLACGWFTWVMFYLYGAFMVGSLTSLLFGVFHVRSPMPVAMLVNNSMWISLVVLIVCTVRAYRKEKKKKIKNQDAACRRR